MRFGVTLVLLAALVLPAGAASKRKQCQQACGKLIARCTSTTGAAGFGNLAKGCGTAVLKRCKTQGTGVCGTFCGNGVVDGAESCDGAALGGSSCASLGFASGTLGCTAGCGFETRGCTPSPLRTCGNGTVESPEACDGAALGGATCASLGYSLGGTLACTPGCGFDVSACTSQHFTATGQTNRYMAARNDALVGLGAVPDDGTVGAGKALAFRDNGDGTITDLNTGLMWEKKSDDGGLHDQDNDYRWSGNGVEETIWDWLEDVNAEGGSGFAGHRDWRIPNVRELQSIVKFGPSQPAVAPVFHTNCAPGCSVSACACTDSFYFWTSTTYEKNLTMPFAWFVYFYDGSMDAELKTAEYAVRAVRGGS